jgi:hypothetical protein
VIMDGRRKHAWRVRDIVVTMMVALASYAKEASAGARPDDPLLTIRVHDYEHLPVDSMQRAQRRVADIYKAIGVRTQWQIVQPAPDMEFDPATIPDPRELLVIVLNPGMSRLKRVADNVIGTAVVTPEDGGRIAYVLFDRIALIASTSAVNSMDVMGTVIAHEIGHLVLPSGSHTTTGLMRPNWTIEELRGTSQLQFGFTPPQQELIRRRLLRWAAAPFTNAIHR